jgi:hypothetical protein
VDDALRIGVPRLRTTYDLRLALPTQKQYQDQCVGNVTMHKGRSTRWSQPATPPLQYEPTQMRAVVLSVAYYPTSPAAVLHNLLGAVALDTFGGLVHDRACTIGRGKGTGMGFTGRTARMH